MKRCAPFVFWVCLVASITLIVTGFFVPPTGVIDGSVITAVGELFGFAALGELPEVIRTAKSARITSGDKTIEIIGENGEQHPPHTPPHRPENP